MYGDSYIVAAWVSVQSIIVLNFHMGIGFSNAIRTYVGIKIGLGDMKTAKRFAVMSLIILFCIYLPIYIFIIVFADKVAYLFTNIPETHEILTIYIVYYGLIMPVDVSLFSCSNLMRFSGKLL